MAVDTREKRQSAFSLLVPSYTPGVFADVMNQAERQAASWVYAGILAQSTGGTYPLRHLGGALYVRPYGVRGVAVY